MICACFVALLDLVWWLEGEDRQASRDRTATSANVTGATTESMEFSRGSDTLATFVIVLCCLQPFILTFFFIHLNFGHLVEWDNIRLSEVIRAWSRASASGDVQADGSTDVANPMATGGEDARCSAGSLQDVEGAAAKKVGIVRAQHQMQRPQRPTGLTGSPDMRSRELELPTRRARAQL